MDGKKIVFVNTVYGSGSVGRITAELYETAGRHGFLTAAAYGRGGAPDGIHAYKIGNRTDFYRHVCYNFVRDGGGFGSAGRTEKFLAWLELEKPDLLHLHNLHGFYLQAEKLFDYIREKRIPVVWTLHDCWPFTGHCAYYDKNGCDKWKSGCGDCRYHAKAYPYALFYDNSRENYQRKKAAFCGADRLTLVTPSRWLAGEAGRSFLGGYPVRVIPNGIDLEVFCPSGETAAASEREAGCPDRVSRHGRQDTGNTAGRQKKNWEILGAANVWEERKGLAYLEELAGCLPQEYHMTLVGLSSGQQQRLRRKFGPERVSLCGRTDSVSRLAAYYRKADIFVNPTLEDVFSMTNLEALACGTPVITFPTGGSPETLHDSCGIVTEAKDTASLLHAVEQMRRAIGRGEFRYSAAACRSRALSFGKEERYGEYLDLYREMLT